MGDEGILKPTYRLQKDFVELLIKDGFIKEDKIDELRDNLEDLKKTINNILEKANIKKL